jgi:DNA-directed RNA polymerase specialized sigma24 family protein
MVSGFLDKISGLGIAGEVKAASYPARLEEEVVCLFGQLRAPVLRYVLSLRISALDAEETVQAVFLSLFQH